MTINKRREIWRCSGFSRMLSVAGFALALLAATSPGQPVQLQGVISNDTTWTAGLVELVDELVVDTFAVLTVEPGLYIPAGSRGVSRKWWGIGIRIEDDVLVTKDGHEVLSAAAPKTVDEIEALMN